MSKFLLTFQTKEEDGNFYSGYHWCKNRELLEQYITDMKNDYGNDFTVHDKIEILEFRNI